MLEPGDQGTVSNNPSLSLPAAVPGNQALAGIRQVP